jgi:alpha,alpha-trehalase
MKRVIAPLALLLLTVASACAAPSRPADINAYIHDAWTTLRRSVARCEAYQDTKVGSRPTLYLPYGMAIPKEVVPLQTKCGVTIAHLPRPIHDLGEVKPSELGAQGLLYLPHPYVVPGGMFNEMYGWDSYFIIRGLLEDGQVDFARGMAENWFFEIEHYGAILNANRTYYLTRSQPPFLTSAVSAIHARTKDRKWLARAYGYAVRDHALWTRPPALAGSTGLSRYFDVGEGPIPEMGAHENYYEHVASWVMTHPGSAPYLRLGKGRGLPTYTARICEGDVCAEPVAVHLSADYFHGDRAMRASGFDVSFRFGPFSGATHHYAAVGLNALLYKEERDLSEFARILGKPGDASRWAAAASARAAAMRRWLEDPSDGLFYDYDFLAHRRSRYHYATTFYPLWAGLVTRAEAARIASHVDIFERAHGLAMSDVESGAQWDLPFGWAPVHLLAVEGLLRYGLRGPALRVARKWNETVETSFRRDHTIREKYDVISGRADTRISVGYSQNVIGFGWTNAVYEVFAHLLRADAPPAPAYRPSPARRTPRNAGSGHSG